MKTINSLNILNFIDNIGNDVVKKEKKILILKNRLDSINLIIEEVSPIVVTEEMLNFINKLDTEKTYICEKIKSLENGKG